MCVANSDVQKYSKVSNEGGVEIFIGRISGFLRTAYRERFSANQWYRWKVYALQRSVFDGHDQSAVISRKIPKNGFQQFTSSVSSHIKHFPEFSVDNIFQPRAKVADKSPNVFWSMCLFSVCFYTIYYSISRVSFGYGDLQLQLSFFSCDIAADDSWLVVTIKF